MTAPRVVRQRIADLATEARDAALAKAADLRAELDELERHAATFDAVTRVVGIERPWLVQPARLSGDAMGADPMDIPEFARAGNG